MDGRLLIAFPFLEPRILTRISAARGRDAKPDGGSASCWFTIARRVKIRLCSLPAERCEVSSGENIKLFSVVVLVVAKRTGILLGSPTTTVVEMKRPAVSSADLTSTTGMTA